MRIKDTLYQKIETFENKKVEDEKQARKQADKAASERDEVSLSPQARELAKTVQKARDEEGVRTERVEELREKVRSGEYQPGSRKIADKLLKNELDLWL